MRILLLLLVSTFVLASCGQSWDTVMTEEEQAAQYNISVEEFREQKEAAARMNMTIEEHMKHMTPWDHSGHNMDQMDDSDMVD